jgi:tRNA modification GTPase
MSGVDLDTIAAVATPPGLGGIGIVRISGPRARAIGEAMTGGRLVPRRASLRTFRDRTGEVLDQGIAIAFDAPDSFTGEQVVELQGHGGPVIVERVLGVAIEAGARHARPGEFSERAFLNGKIDLVQAEAIADLIAAQSVAAARAAMRSLSGDFSKRLVPLIEEALALRVFVEAGVDFPEEQLDLLEQGEVADRLERLCGALERLIASCREGVLLNEGLRIAIVGPPNVGKSSLLNRLAGADEAIVTDIPGTTRDLLKVDLLLGGLPVTLVDTAGLREAGDPVEAEGIRRAQAEAQRADLVLELFDCREPPPAPRAQPPRRLLVGNKADLVDGFGELAAGSVSVSARTGAGIESLISRVHDQLGYHPHEATFTARTRHVEALGRARAAFAVARELCVASPFELVAEELRAGHAALGEVSGAITTDDLLGRIFSTFCIGK